MGLTLSSMRAFATSSRIASVWYTAVVSGPDSKPTWGNDIRLYIPAFHATMPLSYHAIPVLIVACLD